MLPVISDPQFDRHFEGRLMQVFIYVTDECNLRCTQCYYKPWLKTGHPEMPTDVLLTLLEKFRQLGAVKVSFLGGEPTLYGKATNNTPLPSIVRAAMTLLLYHNRGVYVSLPDRYLRKLLGYIRDLPWRLQESHADRHYVASASILRPAENPKFVFWDIVRSSRKYVVEPLRKD